MAAGAFTMTITLFVLAPLAFACVALLGEAHSLVLGIAAVDSRGIGAPTWLAHIPFGGSWLAARWQGDLAHPGALLMLTQRADPIAMLGWAQSLGQFALHQVLIVGFAVLLLHLLYQHGDALGHQFAHSLRVTLGDRGDRFLEIATRAVRASVNSMLLVGLFDTAATALAYSLAGAPRPFVWAAITGALAAVPFLGYLAVGAMALRCLVAGATASAAVGLALGGAVLLCGDKVVRPVVVREGMHLPFAWVLIGCIGGFEALGLAGIVIGPATLALAREAWKQHNERGIAPRTNVHSFSAACHPRRMNDPA
jgi:predicted PurR-regulated permease PerM